jgi:NADH:ubiquinone reductase (H+-translocating)
MPEEKKRVVIIGAGVAGLLVAQQLRKQKELAVTLVNEHDTFLFLPRLTELFSGSIPQQKALLPLKHVWKGDFVLDQANLVNPAEKSIILNSNATLPYDILVVATGSQVNYFNTPGSQYSYPFYSWEDSEKLREHVSRMLEADEQQGTHTFAIIGGGPTGVETAYALAHIVHKQRPGAKVLLLEAGPTILKVLPPKLAEAVRTELEVAHIDIMTNAKVLDITPMSISIERTEGGKETIPCYTSVWAAGSKPRTLQISGIEYTPRGEIPVRPTLQSQVDSNIFALGDCAATGTPKTAQAAVQQAALAAGNIIAHVKGKQLAPFTYAEKGTVVALEKRTAGIFYGKLITGFLAQQARDKYYQYQLRSYQ